MISEEEKDAIDVLENVFIFKDTNDRFTKLDLKCINTVLNLIEKQQKVANLQEKTIQLMAKHIDYYTYRGGNSSYDIDYGCDFELQTKCICDTSKECTECIIEHFKNKAKESE